MYQSEFRCKNWAAVNMMGKKELIIGIWLYKHMGGAGKWSSRRERWINGERGAVDNCKPAQSLRSKAYLDAEVGPRAGSLWRALWKLPTLLKWSPLCSCCLMGPQPSSWWVGVGPALVSRPAVRKMGGMQSWGEWGQTGPAGSSSSVHHRVRLHRPSEWNTCFPSTSQTYAGSSFGQLCPVTMQGRGFWKASFPALAKMTFLNPTESSSYQPGKHIHLSGLWLTSAWRQSRINSD